MRSHNLKLAKMVNHKEQPVISVTGSGANTYIWVGEKTTKGGVKDCFAFSDCSRGKMKRFAQSILNRLEAK